MDSQNPKPPAIHVDGPVLMAAPRRRISRRASIMGAVIALVLVGCLGWLVWHLTHPAAPAAGAPGAPGARPGGPGGPGGRGAATTVGVAVAETMDIPVVLEALGTVVPQATVRVRPQVGGVLQQILFKEGQTVRKGDLLAIIDPRPYELALQQVIGQRQRDEAQIEAARVTLQRFTTLLQQDSIARQEVDTQAALVKQLEAATVISRANEGTARLNLAYTRIVAPISGRVGLRTVDVGNVVGTGDTNGVAVITQMSPIDVEFAIPQDQAAGLQQNSQAPMEAKALDRTRSTVLETGVFASLDNQVDTQTGTVRAKARFANAKLALFPSQFVNVRLQLRNITGAVVVPVSALRTGPNGDYVFLLRQDRTVTIRPVTRGQATVDRVQIATGLQAGDRVITEGADRLREGARVTLPGDAPRGAASGAGGAGGMRERRQAASGPQAAAPAGASSAAQPASPAPAAPPAPAGAAARPPAPAQAAGPVSAKPTAEQRQRMLETTDPVMLERRKKFLEAIDRGDPAALERWQQLQQQRREGGGAGAGGQNN